MAHCRFIPALFLACTFAVSAGQLSPPVRRSPFSQIAVPGGPGAPKWAGGHLILFRPSTTHSDLSNNLAVQDGEGRTVLETRVWVPDATQVWIRDVETVEGEAVAVGNAMVGNLEYTGFLAFIPIKGGAARIVRTAPFEGMSMAVGPDRSVWVLGWQLGEERRILKAPDHAMLQHYDRDGKFIGGSLPWSSFRCGLHPVAGPDNGHAQVRASKDRIGVLLPTCHEWVEFNTSGELTGRWSWRDVPISNGLKSSTMISSVVMTPSNEVFARIGIGLYRLNREQGTWDPVDLTAATDAGAIFGWLAGHYDESLVYLSQRELVRADVRKQ
ncbi:MAG: hypothetical protein LLG20_00890 [Acidobacteriales bacterium]|nr:hypothetical protein [Terriglobales bacterium]